MPRSRSSCPATTDRRARDRGLAVVMLPVVLVLAAVLAVGAARLGSAVVDEHRAQVAADAAALAGVRGGEPAAAELAGANGARLVSFVRQDHEVLVVVVRGVATATARASDGP